MTQHRQPGRDVRMRGFARRTTVADALKWLDGQIVRLDEESVPLGQAAGRVLAREIVSHVDVPAFARSMMDGFALRAADVMGASPYNRLALEVVGESLPGSPFLGDVPPGKAVRIMTGAPLPTGADAVLPAELVEAEGDRILAQGDVSPGKHVGRVGEDITAGTVVLKAGRVLRPQDVGVLASIGSGEVAVVRRPRVMIVVTGNELLPAAGSGQWAAGSGQATADIDYPPSTIHYPLQYKIVDSNGPMLAALVERDGGVALNPGIVPDEPEAVLRAMRCGEGSGVRGQGAGGRGQESGVRGQGSGAGGSLLSTLNPQPSTLNPQPSTLNPPLSTIHYPLSTPPEADVVLVSGGSSVGQEDHAPTLLAEHGELSIHGIAMRPSSPTGMGRLDGRLVLLLPGNPVSCLCAYDFFAGRAIRVLGGRPADWPYRRVVRPLARKIVSTVGRLDYMRVCLVEGRVEPLAIAGASVLSSTTRADGFVLVPPDSEGYPPGAEVEVFLYD